VERRKDDPDMMHNEEATGTRYPEVRKIFRVVGKN